tara:strand:- start:519 stop:758 length:240 start_codon:yes stop_codon:yes gene_type:complete
MKKSITLARVSAQLNEEDIVSRLMWLTMDYRLNHKIDSKRIFIARPFEVLAKLKVKDKVLYEFCKARDIKTEEVISFFW